MSDVKATGSVTVNNPEGLHARPADAFVKTASRFESTVSIVKDSVRADGKSILEMLTLAAEQGSILNIETIGSDAEAALDALSDLVNNNFVDKDQQNQTIN